MAKDTAAPVPAPIGPTIMSKDDVVPRVEEALLEVAGHKPAKTITIERIAADTYTVTIQF